MNGLFQLLYGLSFALGLRGKGTDEKPQILLAAHCAHGEFSDKT